MATGGVDDTIDGLIRAADAMADQAERVGAEDWARTAPVEGGAGERDAQAVLWDAVDAAVADLKAAEAVLREVRGRAG